MLSKPDPHEGYTRVTRGLDHMLDWAYGNCPGALGQGCTLTPEKRCALRQNRYPKGRG